MDTNAATSTSKASGPEIPNIPEPSPIVRTQSAAIEALKDITFGSFAGIVGKVVEYPFDTVKVRLQSQPDHLPLQYNGPLDCFRQSIQKDGIRGLYRGVSAPFAGAAAETACLFWTYRLAQNFLRTTYYTNVSPQEALPLNGLVTAGAISGGITSVILTPIELVKCRMQVPLQSTLDPTLGPRTTLSTATLSPLAVTRDVYRREGFKGFWRGQLGTFLRETGGTAAWFGSYEACSLFFKQRIQTGQAQHAHQDQSEDETASLPLHLQMASGAIAGMCYNFIFFPADTIKSKIQTGELTSVRPTFTSVARELWRVHGLKGLYRGCGITVARSAPSSALIFSIMETLKEWLK